MNRVRQQKHSKFLRLIRDQIDESVKFFRKQERLLETRYQIYTSIKHVRQTNMTMLNDVEQTTRYQTNKSNLRDEWYCHVMSKQWLKIKSLISIKSSDLTVQSFLTRNSLLRISRINSTRIVVSLYTSWLSLYAFDQRSLITRSYISLTILIRLNL